MDGFNTSWALRLAVMNLCIIGRQLSRCWIFRSEKKNLWEAGRGWVAADSAVHPTTAQEWTCHRKDRRALTEAKGENNYRQ